MILGCVAVPLMSCASDVMVVAPKLLNANAGVVNPSRSFSSVLDRIEQEHRLGCPNHSDDFFVTNTRAHLPATRHASQCTSKIFALIWNYAHSLIIYTNLDCQ